MGLFTEPLTATEAPQPDAPGDRLRETVHDVRRKAKAFAGLILAAALISGTVAVLLPSHYTAQASFFPESRNPGDLGSGMGNLAALAGVMGGPLGMGLRPAEFFTDLAKSRTFFDSLAASAVQVDSARTAMQVQDYLVPRARDPGDRRWKARKALKKAITAVALPSGMVVISVTSKSPYASAALANRAIEVIDELNIDFRRREAVARRRFTQQFLEEVQQRLAGAQERLVQFLTSNRTFVAPELLQRQRSLQTEVERLTLLQQQLETSIENARLTEYNDAPVVATVDVAGVPEKPSGPLRWLIVVGAVMLVVFGGLWALYLGLWR